MLIADVIILCGLIFVVLSFTIDTAKICDIFRIESYMKDFMEELYLEYGMQYQLFLLY